MGEWLTVFGQRHPAVTNHSAPSVSIARGITTDLTKSPE